MREESKMGRDGEKLGKVGPSQYLVWVNASGLTGLLWNYSKLESEPLDLDLVPFQCIS